MPRIFKHLKLKILWSDFFKVFGNLDCSQAKNMLISVTDFEVIIFRCSGFE